MNLADFDFELPAELIAQEPSPERGQSRLLVMQRNSGTIVHTRFAELAEYLIPGDLVVLNNTRVFPSRLLGRREPTGGAVECLLLKELPNSQLPTPNLEVPPRNSKLPIAESSAIDAHTAGSRELEVGSSFWDALMHPGQKLKPGARALFERNGVRVHAEVVARHFHGRRTVRLWTEDGSAVSAAVDRIGHVPLPPYIAREDRPSDRDRYQTVYARDAGSVAAPTAGLHFTNAQLDVLAARGVERAEVTLHVGYGTFKPVRHDRVEDHVVDAEGFTVSAAAADAVTRARREGRRVIAVGTTTTRALESLQVGDDGSVAPTSGNTTLCIRPGHPFRIVAGLITNFHLPRSSLLILVAALAGRERLLAAYGEAIERRYRFYSYGDAMLIV